MPHPDADPSLEIRIQAAIRRLNAGAVLVDRQVSEQLGVGPSDAQFLALLREHGPLTPGRLARLSGLTTGSVTGVIDRLEQAGYVRRDRDPSDRRKVIVARDEERIQRLVGPLEELQAAGLRRILAVYKRRQLELIADFVDRIAAEPADSRRDAEAR